MYFFCGYSFKDTKNQRRMQLSQDSLMKSQLPEQLAFKGTGAG
jgi:hypothetical protein